jgi:hypothetical protein
MKLDCQEGDEARKKIEQQMNLNQGRKKTQESGCK